MATKKGYSATLSSSPHSTNPDLANFTYHYGEGLKNTYQFTGPKVYSDSGYGTLLAKLRRQLNPGSLKPTK